MRRYSLQLYFFKGLTWFATLIAVLAVDLPSIEAFREGSRHKESFLSKFNHRSSEAGDPVSDRRHVEARSSPIAAPIDPLEARNYVTIRLRTGQTFPDLLAAYALAVQKRLEIASTQRGILRPLPAGRDVRRHFAELAAIPDRLRQLQVDPGQAFTLAGENELRGMLFQHWKRSSEAEVKTVRAEVDTSLFEDGRKAGVHPSLLSQLADIFTWDMDLKTAEKGDSVKIVYEDRGRSDRESESSLRILAAEVNKAGQKLTAVYFEKEEGQGNYYDLDGRSLARSFLRFPLEFVNVTSHFSESRFHPILRTNMPHRGVDFAAPRGTPVRAVGDGVISHAGWNGPYGKTIDIQHDSTYTSRYAHLHGFASGIHNGASVAKGQIIGYVGSTGRATGPHLHFELLKDQESIDPLNVDLPAEDSIEPALQRIFEHQTRTYLVELSARAEASPQS